MQRLEQRVLDLLSRGQKRPLNRRDIAERLRLRGAERKQLTVCLKQLVRSGLVEERQGGYRPAPEQGRLEGNFSLADQGYGFLRTDDERQEDLFIPARHVGTAMDGDRVLAQKNFSPRDRRPFGQVLQVLERAHQRIIGYYRQSTMGGEVWPLDPKLGGPVRVKKQTDLPPGTVVEVEMETYASGGAPARGRIAEVLGPVGDPQVDIETVIRSRNLPHRFSAAALQEAEQIAQSVLDKELAGRADLRDLPLVTIDGETARDFDDAVALRRQGDGNFRLWVCIADVSHYLPAGSAIDRDALERGTSVYFPGFCLPMLPELLSNGICSLNPEEDRLVMTAELCLSPRGERLQASFYPALMRSRARLTYTRVSACLDAPEQSDLSAELVTQLQEMAELAKALTAMRHRRGSLDLDLPEVEVLLDEKGRPIDLVKVERNQAHRLIEEFMLAANEAVAAFLQDRNWPFLYRIHEPPAETKLQEFQQLAAECGVGLILGKNLQQELQKLLGDIAGRPEARLLNQQLLRSLQQACYAAENQGHFGLAADCYCHFTSPIRRYPDLAVHRVLKQALAGADPGAAPVRGTALAELGRACSDQERRAMAAERDLIELRRCQLMEQHLGEEFTGIISSVTEFGFFVELDDYFVEGLVHIRSLRDDFYHFDPLTRTLAGERRRKLFQVGRCVTIRIAKVELWRRRLDFTLVEMRK